VEQKAATSTLLSKAGATIQVHVDGEMPHALTRQELNTIRKHLSRIKVLLILLPLSDRVSCIYVFYFSGGKYRLVLSA
jgi:hypothetical protein